MEALDVDIEQRVRVERDARLIERDARQLLLVEAACRDELVDEGGILGKALQRAQVSRIIEKSGADRIDQELSQMRIGAVEPAPEGDAVRLVDDTVWIGERQIAEDRLAHEFRVQRRDTVDMAGADKGEIAHPN